MDFLNRATAQLSDLFRSMTPGARLTAGLLLIVVVISLGYLFQHEMTGPDDVLLGGETVSAAAMHTMEEAFGKANLGTYTVVGGQIHVPHSQKAAYMAALADAKALPPNFGSAMQKALENGSVLESRQIREARIKAGNQEELSLIIRSMPGIESASVLIDTESQGGLNPVKLKTASVAVKPSGSTQLDESRVESIRYLVAGAIAGMPPENVTVADLNGRIHRGDPETGDGAGGSLFLAVTQEHERLLKAKVLDALAYIVPSPTVTATVVLDHDKSTRSESLKNDPKPIARRTTEKSRTRTRDSGTTGGRPGLASQQGNTPTTLAAATSSKGGGEQEEETTSETDNSIGQTHEAKETVGLTPKSARVSVGISTAYFEKIWRERNPAKEGDEAKKPDQAAMDAIREEITTNVRKHVAAQLPPAEGVSDPTEQVTVMTFPEIKGSEIPAPAAGEKAMSWFSQNWATVGLGGLVLVSLYMLRSMVRSVPATEPEPQTTSLRIAGTDSDSSSPSTEAPEALAARRLRRLSGNGPSLRDELSDMVKEDPDAAANILRTWIGQVG